MTVLLMLLKKYWVWLAAGAGELELGIYFHHQWYQAGYDEGVAKTAEVYQLAASDAQKKFTEELAKRDAALADAQGKVVEVVRWKTKTQTIYQEAVKNDQDCADWASQPIACPLGLPVGPSPDHGAAVPVSAGNAD